MKKAQTTTTARRTAAKKPAKTAATSRASTRPAAAKAKTRQSTVVKPVKTQTKALKALEAAKATPGKKTIAHHARRIFHLTPKFVHGMVAGAFVGVVAVLALHATMPASALTISSATDCDSNAVIKCGALTTSQLQKGYTLSGVSAIYHYFGISADDIKNVDKLAVAGTVYKDGRVAVNGKVVATGAITAGRENITGSTKVSSGGMTFYKRPPSVSFVPSSLNGFVFMKDGQFAFAILGACGNPVIATPIPKTTPKPPAPTPTPTPPTGTSTQTPPSTPVQPPTVATTTAAELPNTGPGAVILIAIMSVVGGYIFHTTHRHVRRKRQAHHA